MKFTDGYMIKTGYSKSEYVDSAVRHVLMRQGVLGVRVLIMLPQDSTGKTGPKASLADVVTIVEPKSEETVIPPVDYEATQPKLF